MVALEISTERRPSNHPPGNASVDPTFESRECPVECRDHPWAFAATRLNPVHLCDLESFPAPGRAFCCAGASDDGLGDPATAGSDAVWSTAQLSFPRQRRNLRR